MPNVTATPRGQSNGQVITEFIDSVGTSSVTYSYPKTQEMLSIRNTGGKSVTVTVAGTIQTIQPGTKWENIADFSFFNIVSTSGVQSFEARSDEKGSTFDSPEGAYFARSFSPVQADFVDIIKDRTSYKNMSFTRLSQTGTPSERYEISLDNGNEYVHYDFIKDVNDDFIKLERGEVGAITPSGVTKADAANLTGTWNTASPPNYYATTVGATFTVSLTGTTLIFNSFRDNRGGVWSLVIDGDTANPVTVSTYTTTGTSNIQQTIATGLSDVTHTVVGTFQGDDPANPPSSGAGTARGWAYYQPSSTTIGTIIGHTADYQDKAMLISAISNKEIALNVTVNGVTKWIPDHDEGGVAFVKKPTKFMIDGVLTDPSTLTLNQTVACSDFRLVQQMNITFAGVSGIIAELYVVHHIDKRGIVSYSGHFKALQALKVNSLYPLMLPINDVFINEFVTGIGSSKVSAADDSAYFFGDEQDRVYSAVGVSSVNQNFVVAGKVDHPMRTMRQNKPTGKTSLSQSLYFWQRAGTPKLYWIAGSNFPMGVNDVYSWSGQIVAAWIENAYKFFKF